jgi:hypothetical protein
MSVGTWGPPPPPSTGLIFIGHNVSIVDTNIYTYNAQSAGPAGNRHTIIGVVGRDSASTDFSILGLTVNGVAATSVVTNAIETGSTLQTGIFIIDNPIGETMDIVVTFSETVTQSAIAVWAAYDLVSSTPTATAQQFQTASANINLSLNVDAGGFAVGISGNGSTVGACTWAGFAARFDADSPSEALSYSGADYTATTAQTPLTIGADWTGTDDAAGVAASWGIV